MLNSVRVEHLRPFGTLWTERITAMSREPWAARAFAFFLVGAFGGAWIPFYPPWMAVLIGVVCGVVSYRFPILALILLSLFVTGSAASQTPEFGIVFIVLSLVIVFCSFFDWRFGLVVFGVLFLSRMGLSFAVVLLAAAMLPAFLTLSATVVSVLLLLFVGSCANLNSLGFVVAAPHVSSFMLFLPVQGDVFSPGEIFAAYDSMQYADLDAVMVVSGGNLGASVVPFLVIFAWGVAAYLMHLAGHVQRLPLAQRSALALGAGISIALAYLVPAWHLYSALEPLALSAAVLVVMGGPALLYTSLWLREHYAEHFMLQASAGTVGRRVAEMADLEESSFESIGGLADVKADLKESIMVPLLRPDLAARFGIALPKGILLFGPPGCGKTLLMKALASELDVEMITVKCSDIMSKWYGESEAKIAELFETAKKRRPCIIFFDDLEAIAKNRDFYAGDDVTPRLLSIILSELDGMDRSSGLILVGTTNRPEMIDPALLRPGRFDKVIYVPPPSSEERVEILRVHLAGRPVEEMIDLAEVAKRAERYSGADLANVVREAAMKAMRREIQEAGSKITTNDLLEVIKLVKPSVTLAMIEEYELLKLDYQRKMHYIAREEHRASITWEDIVGADRTKQDIRDYIELLMRRPDLVEGFKLKPGRGVLLFGPRGCGKGLVVQATARALGLPLQVVNCSELVSHLGTNVSVKEVFQRARENAPSVILLEDIDILASSDAAGEPESRRVLGQIMAEVDNIEAKGYVLVVATTHLPHRLQKDVLRTGRFDKLFYVPSPDRGARELILRRLLRDLPIAGDVDSGFIASLAQRSEGYASADVAAVVDEAKLIAVVNRDACATKQPVITRAALEKAFERVHPAITGEEMEGIERFMAVHKVRR